MADEEVLKLWHYPYFTLGALEVTPLFLVKLFAFFVVIALGARSLKKLLRRELLDRTTLDVGQRAAVEHVTGYVITIGGLMVGFHTMGVNLNSLALIGGSIGVGIGLGMQSLASNFISGLILLAERPIKVGDRIEVGDVDGRVVRIGSRATWIRANANRMIIVPNGKFTSERVTNWTADDPTMRFAIHVPVAYGSNMKQVREVLLEAARAHPDVLAQPAPDVILTGIGDSSVDFDLRVWTERQVQTPRHLTSDLYLQVVEALEANGIGIPYRHQDVRVRWAVEAPVVP